MIKKAAITLANQRNRHEGLPSVNIGRRSLGFQRGLLQVPPSLSLATNGQIFLKSADFHQN
jgi:hypothetical protein